MHMRCVCRCAERQGPDGKWNQYGGKMAWDESAICSDNQSFGGKGAPKTGDDYAAAPNVDHTKDFVRKVSGLLSLVYTFGHEMVCCHLQELR